MVDLPEPVRPTMAIELAGRNVERDVVDDLVIAIREREIFHFDAACDLRGRGERTVRDFGDGIEDLLQTARSRRDRAEPS